MAWQRPSWQLCKWCNEVKERPCIDEVELYKCHDGQQAKRRRQEAQWRAAERMFKESQ